MKAEQLRKSILQLAIQGKLVPQIETEEPASILLQKISTEKQELIKQGKIKKEKEVEPIKEDEIPFDIPESWEWIRISECCTSIFNGKSPVYVKHQTKNIILGQQANQETGIVLNHAKYCDDNFLSRIPDEMYLKDFDILLNTLGNGTLGRVGLFKNTIGSKIITDGHLFVFRTNNNILAQYIFIYLKQQRREIEKSANGTTNQVFLSLAKTSNMLIPIPPLAEQRRIVAKIDEIMTKIDEYEKYETELSSIENAIQDKLKKSILQHAIQGKLVPQSDTDEPASELLKRIQIEKQELIKQGKLKKEKELPLISEEENPFDIPNSWEWIRLAKVFEINPNNKLDDDLEVSFLPMSLLKGNYQNAFTTEIKKWSKVKSGFVHFRNNDVCFAKITPCFQNKKSAVLHNLTNGYGAGSTELHILRCFKETIIPQFTLAYIKSEYFISYGKSKFAGTAGQQRFGTSSVKNALFPLPPLAEQQRIVDKIEQLFASIEALFTKKLKSEQLSKIIEFVSKPTKQVASFAQAAQGDPKDLDKLFEDKN